MSKFFKDNKIARAHQAKATCGLENLQVLICIKLHEKSSHYLQDKSITESQDRQNFYSTLFIICTHLTTLYSCYMKNTLISANHECLIFKYVIDENRENINWGTISGSIAKFFKLTS